MILFTQNDYLKYSQQMKSTLKETSEKYILDKFTHQYNDKIFKELLSDKKEFISFIAKFLKNTEFNKFSINDIEKLRNGDDETMKFEKYFIELLKDEQKKGEKRGKEIGKKRGEEIGIAKTINLMVKGMLQKQMSDEDIMDIAKINKEELEKLKMAQKKSILLD